MIFQVVLSISGSILNVSLATHISLSPKCFWYCAYNPGLSCDSKCYIHSCLISSCLSTQGCLPALILNTILQGEVITASWKNLLQSKHLSSIGVIKTTIGGIDSGFLLVPFNISWDLCALVDSLVNAFIFLY